MSDVNHCTFTGRLTRDGDLRRTPKDMAVINYTVACNTKDHGTGQEDTIFIECSTFGKRADAIAKYMKRGLGLSIAGKLRVGTWKKSDGAVMTSLKMTVSGDNLQFRAPYQDNPPGMDGTHADEAQQYEQEAKAPARGKPQEEDSDLPF